MEGIKINSKNVALYNSLVSTSEREWTYQFPFLDFMKINFDYYNAHVEKLEGYVKEQVSKRQDITDALTSNLLCTMSHYLAGRVPLAYGAMRSAFDSVKDILIRKSESRATRGAEFGFRARVVNRGNPPLTSKADMFHIPFEKRHLVNDQRYSIRGFPSVYLGRSIYGCYLEMGSPPLDSFFVSLFYFLPNKDDAPKSQRIRLIDLTDAESKEDIFLMLSSVEKDELSHVNTLNRIVDNILLWPLVMSCSVIRSYQESPHFRAEYIIPQMLYQLCSEKDEFSGIEYDSAKNLAGGNKKKLRSVMQNYALPIQKILPVGHCPILAGQLCLTEPITAKMCDGMKIVERFGHTVNSLPIISAKCDTLKENETILALDRMTMYFDEILLNFRQGKDLAGISPLYGWRAGS